MTKPHKDTGTLEERVATRADEMMDEDQILSSNDETEFDLKAEEVERRHGASDRPETDEGPGTLEGRVSTRSEEIKDEEQILSAGDEPDYDLRAEKAELAHQKKTH